MRQHKKRRLALVSLQMLAASAAMAQSDVFTLGEIRISAPAADIEISGSSVVNKETIRAENRENVATALELVPGTHLGYAGARGEQVFYVRGFDRLQVPIYIDGIPNYIPYDGRVDLGHFSTFDLSRIEVAKGFSSMMYGPNALGGAVNLITRRPTKAFEGEVGGGIGLNDDGQANSHRLYANLGGKQDSWWFQGGLSTVKTDSFDLPGGFVPTNVQQGPGERNNSRRHDNKLSLKLGLTPRAGDEYVFGYVQQRGEKGQPTYAGLLPLTGSGSGMRARWWEWPQWDKTSYFFTSNTRVGAHVLRARLYHDQFENSLVSRNYAGGVVGGVASGFPSLYDDDSTGLSLEGDFLLSETNRLQLAYHFKDDVHRSMDAGRPWTYFKDRTHALSVEDTLTLSDTLTLVGGLSYQQRKSLAARNFGTHAGSPSVPTLYDEPGGSNNAVNAQLGLFQKAGAGQARLTVASKSRFATMMERYSTRFGTVIPNPDLKAERARHYEIGYAGPVAPGWSVDAALFRSDIRDSIQTVAIPVQSGCGTACSQPQNIAKARATGLELGLQGDLGTVQLMGNYTWLERKNISAPSVLPTDTPRQRLFLSASWRAGAWKHTASAEAASQRHSSSDGRQIAHGFAVYHLKTAYTFRSGVQLEAGVRNLFDKVYAYAEGYPMAGRNYFVNFNAPF